MFDSQLTLSGLKAEVGEHSGKFEYVFTKDDPYVCAVKVIIESQRKEETSSDDEFNAVLSTCAENPFYNALQRYGLQDDDKDSVHELIWNALEHGSLWGEQGSVAAEVINDVKNNQICISIEQPLPGFDVKKIASHTRKEIGETLSGGGLSDVRRNANRTGFEHLSGDHFKFRTILILQKEEKA